MPPYLHFFLGAVLITVLALNSTCAGGVANNLRESTYQQLAKVHRNMEREDYALALQRLDALRPRVERSHYEKAVVLQTYGYLYTAMDRYDAAIEVIQESLALQSLPKEVTRNLLYLSAQLRIAQADYTGALADLTQWFAGEKTPQADAHALAGVAYAHLEEHTAAIKHLELAVNANATPREVHMRQLLAVYVEARRYPAAARLLQRIIERYPGQAADWRQLSGLYRELGNERESLAILELTYRRGLLKSERDLLTLANYYLYLDAPHEAAKLLALSIRAGAVASTQENWELLAGAWSRSRESAKAIQAMARAAAFTDDPDLHLKRARIAATGEDWEQVLAAVEEAFGSGSLDRTGEAHLLAGIAHHQRGETSAALAAFTEAEKHSVARIQARQWLDYLAFDSD